MEQGTVGTRNQGLYPQVLQKLLTKIVKKRDQGIVATINEEQYSTVIKEYIHNFKKGLCLQEI